MSQGKDIIEGMAGRITGGRHEIAPSAKLCDDVSLVGFALAPANPEEFEKRITPVHSHYCVLGVGDSQGAAELAFWEDYSAQGPYADGDIFWRTKPMHETLKEFDTKKTLHKFTSRFSIKG